MLSKMAFELSESNHLESNASQEDYEDIPIEFPGFDETQIIDDIQREVALYLSVKDGKVTGAETTSFILPRRWTYVTLRHCVEDYIQRSGLSEKPVHRLFYKRAKGKSVVHLNGEGDVAALINEYPTHYPSGKKKPQNGVMYLAVEFEEKGGEKDGVRKSPRFQGQRHFDIFIHKYTDGKVSSTADTLHNISSFSSLSDIIQEMVLMKSSTTYIPQKGLYWLQKGSKQPVVLKTDEDLELCKREYNNKGAIKLACEHLPSSSSDSEPISNNRKRKLDMDGGKKADNELWNDIHVSLVRDLEKKGIMWRYNISHLKVWTDLICEGRLDGVGEEPIWEDHLEIVKIPPKSRRSIDNPSTSSVSPSTSSSLEMMNMFQTTLIALLGSNQRNMVPFKNDAPSTSNGHDKGYKETKTTETKAIQELSREDVQKLLQRLGLQCYVETFMKNDIDGPMLEAILDPVLGEGLLVNLGIHDKGHRQRFITEVYKAKAHGFKLS